MAEVGCNFHDNFAKDRALLSPTDNLILQVILYHIRSVTSSKDTGLFSALNKHFTDGTPN